MLLGGYPIAVNKYIISMYPFQIFPTLFSVSAPLPLYWPYIFTTVMSTNFLWQPRWNITLYWPYWYSNIMCPTSKSSNNTDLAGDHVCDSEVQSSQTAAAQTHRTRSLTPRPGTGKWQSSRSRSRIHKWPWSVHPTPPRWAGCTALSLCSTWSFSATPVQSTLNTFSWHTIVTVRQEVLTVVFWDMALWQG